MLSFLSRNRKLLEVDLSSEMGVSWLAWLRSNRRFRVGNIAIIDESHFAVSCPEPLETRSFGSSRALRIETHLHRGKPL